MVSFMSVVFFWCFCFLLFFEIFFVYFSLFIFCWLHFPLNLFFLPCCFFFFDVCFAKWIRIKSFLDMHRNNCNVSIKVKKFKILCDLWDVGLFLCVCLFRCFVLSTFCKRNNFASKHFTFVIVGMMIINKYSLWSMMTLSCSKSLIKMFVIMVTPC